MEKIVLENEELYVEINSVGAELSRIKKRKMTKNIYGMQMKNIGKDIHLFYFLLLEA